MTIEYDVYYRFSEGGNMQIKSRNTIDLSEILEGLAKAEIMDRYGTEPVDLSVIVTNPDENQDG